MHDMYNLFSREAQQAIGIAYKEAEAWGHDYVGTEHLLLAFTKMRTSEVCKFLEANGLTYQRVTPRDRARGRTRPIALRPPRAPTHPPAQTHHHPLV
jgi:ATP-dependent Clp protease ATP-binding subunit ClpA